MVKGDAVRVTCETASNPGAFELGNNEFTHVPAEGLVRAASCWPSCRAEREVCATAASCQNRFATRCHAGGPPDQPGGV